MNKTIQRQNWWMDKLKKHQKPTKELHFYSDFIKLKKYKRGVNNRSNDSLTLIRIFLKCLYCSNFDCKVVDADANQEAIDSGTTSMTCIRSSSQLVFAIQK